MEKELRAGARFIFFLLQADFGPNQPPVKWIQDVVSAGVKRQERESKPLTTI
jgi:hypothetical protein